MSTKKKTTPKAPKEAKEKAPAKPSLFTTIRALSETRPLTYDDIVGEGWPYDTFMINRAFSLSQDTIILAAMMNERGRIDNAMHAAFYVATVRPRRRFETWPKELKDEEITLLVNYYGFSPREAKLHLGLHTEEQLTEMKHLLQDGVRFTR